MMSALKPQWLNCVEFKLIYDEEVKEDYNNPPKLVYLHTKSIIFISQWPFGYLIIFLSKGGLNVKKIVSVVGIEIRK